ncbi:MAG TPA: dihydrodipicolinate synthase family protein [Acidimicrobiales bacterium]|jgi:4-hydroxy-tetrahydrodipicolinate synthase|nr:dihydrodipicolinate synthase family protein [Acidimicrobiales bacterium]
MAATPFDTSGALDEHALRAHLRRMVDAGVAVYLGSGGAGEGHALTMDELRRIYEIGVEECKGRVPTYANPRESRTADSMLELAQAAVRADVEVVQLYPVDAGHGMRPTPAEQDAYYRDLLDAIDHPTALSVHVAVGYITPIPLLAQLCNDYAQVVAVNLMGTPPSYQVELADALRDGIDLYVPISFMVQGLALGARGCLAAEPNIAPRLCRSLVDAWIAGDIQRAGARQADVLRLASIVNRWAPSTARWVKMALKVLGLPGGNGQLRKPYLLPPDEDQQAMAAAFDAIGLRQLERMA